jgi:hypothetical protein
VALHATNLSHKICITVSLKMIALHHILLRHTVHCLPQSLHYCIFRLHNNVAVKLVKIQTLLLRGSRTCAMHLNISARCVSSTQLLCCEFRLHSTASATLMKLLKRIKDVLCISHIYPQAHARTHARAHTMRHHLKINSVTSVELKCGECFQNNIYRM